LSSDQALAESTEKSTEPLLLGRISGVFGVEGWVKLFSYTDPKEAILEYQDCLLQQRGSWNQVRWKAGRRQGKTVVACIEGIDDRDKAEALIGSNIGIWRKDLPETGNTEYYWADLEGLSVVNKNGEKLGVVAYLLATGANDVLVVQGDQEILIPFITGRYVIDVDRTASVIHVDWEWD
jgi:16S rRNA processing protein RimM